MYFIKLNQFIPHFYFICYLFNSLEIFLGEEGQLVFYGQYLVVEESAHIKPFRELAFTLFIVANINHLQILSFTLFIPRIALKILADHESAGGGR